MHLNALDNTLQLLYTEQVPIYNRIHSYAIFHLIQNFHRACCLLHRIT